MKILNYEPLKISKQPFQTSFKMALAQPVHGTNNGESESDRDDSNSNINPSGSSTEDEAERLRELAE